MLDQNKIPKHIAIIMDGNRRWAKKQGLPAIAGHAKAMEETVEALIERAGELGVEYLTLWAFSTENWGRAEDEVVGLMNLFRKALMTKVEKFIAKGAKLRIIGDMSRFAPDIQEGMKKAMVASEKNSKITVTFALNYGGRDEIVRAVNRWMQNHKSSDHSPRLAGQGSELGGQELEKYLDTVGMPDPDLIIRTGGEQRTSGFLMWSAAYAEYYFTEKLFPEFAPSELDRAVEEFQSRQRRFGK